MITKVPIENLRQIARAARDIGGGEVGVAAQLFVDLLISAQVTNTALSAEMFKDLLEHRLTRYRSQVLSVNQTVH